VRGLEVADAVAASVHAWCDVIGNGRIVGIDEGFAADPAGDGLSANLRGLIVTTTDAGAPTVPPKSRKELKPLAAPTTNAVPISVGSQKIQQARGVQARGGASVSRFSLPVGFRPRRCATAGEVPDERRPGATPESRKFQRRSSVAPPLAKEARRGAPWALCAGSIRRFRRDHQAVGSPSPTCGSRPRR
jgi:hypothetical protein